MSRGWAVLLCVLLVGCSGAARSVRHATGQQERCVYVPRSVLATGARSGASHVPRAGVEVVPVAATLGAASPAVPLTPPTPRPLEGLSGEGLGDGIPRGVLWLVPEGGTAAAEAGASGTAGELVVTAGSVVAAAGSVLLFCFTVEAVVDGSRTPVEVADEFYGTHVGDVSGWIQGRYRAKARTPLCDLYEGQSEDPPLLLGADQHGRRSHQAPRHSGVSGRCLSIPEPSHRRERRARECCVRASDG
jgi:hypothetical protein